MPQILLYEKLSESYFFFIQNWFGHFPLITRNGSCTMYFFFLSGWSMFLSIIDNKIALIVIKKIRKSAISVSRQRGRFAGFSLYLSNTGDIHDSTLCYKDGPELPSLNFTTICPEYGRYVIFYNERLDGVSYPNSYELTNAYTELCEVIVQGIILSHLYQYIVIDQITVWSSLTY